MELDCSGIPFRPSLDYGGKRNKGGQGFAAFGKLSKEWMWSKEFNFLGQMTTNISNLQY
jgi:hypothetical protein